MVIKGDEKRLKRIINKFKQASSFSHMKTAKKMNLTKGEFRSIYLKAEVYQAFLDTVSPPVVDFIFKYWLNIYSDCASEILSKSPFDELKIWVIEAGYIEDIDIFDTLTDSNDISVRIYALKRCSFEKLKEFKSDKNIRVRRLVFERLGPKECLDDMLADKNWEIRVKGVRYAPFNYPKLSDMATEKSKPVFIELVKKINDDLLPILLGSKHIRDPKVEALLEKRMDGEIVIEPFI